MSKPFKFKQFSIHQDKCAMKVGTDSVLLGVFAHAKDPKSILDIGSGTGLLTLIMAQKYTNAKITAVEIDEAAYLQSQQNISNSKFSQQIILFNQNILCFKPQNCYDLIITNPPYYKQKNNYKIEDEQRSKARHDKDLPFVDLIDFVLKNLNTEGCFWLILPTKEANEFLALCAKKLFLNECVSIKPKPTKQPNRMILCFSLVQTKKTEKIFTVYNEDGSPTNEYIDITKEFYLWKAFDDEENLKW
ncbi:MAG: tRNA1(Val) (adenine(37)-N6)-methyltransferase [Bacteroidia bacterium]